MMNKLIKNLNNCYPDKIQLKDQREINHVNPLDIENSKESACYSILDAWLVLAHTFLFMLIYYGNAPTSADYSEALNVPVAITGVIQALTPGLGFFSVFFYNWSSKNSYTWSYYISFICLISGTFLYASAYSFSSVISLILARSLIGFGAGRGLTKKFFTLEITVPYMAIYSSLLSGVSNSCISLGPGLSSLLIYIPEFKFLFYENQSFSIFTFVFFFIFIILALTFFPLFKDIPSSRVAKKKTAEKPSLDHRRERFIKHLEASHQSLSFSSIESDQVEYEYEDDPRFKDYMTISEKSELLKFLKITEKEK